MANGYIFSPWLIAALMALSDAPTGRISKRVIAAQLEKCSGAGCPGTIRRRHCVPTPESVWVMFARNTVIADVAATQSDARRILSDKILWAIRHLAFAAAAS